MGVSAFYGPNPPWDFEDRLYVDLNEKPITGILKGFYRFPDTETNDVKNDQYVENGKVRELP